MPSAPPIPGRIRMTAADFHMEALAKEALDRGGIHLRFTLAEYDTKAETLKLAKRAQSAFGVYRARARRRSFLIQKQMGYDPNPLTFEHPYDAIEVQVHEVEDGHEVRMVMFEDLYKGMILTDTQGNPIERESKPLPPKAVTSEGKRMSADEFVASLKESAAAKASED
jgi:dGTP triphosphohydrolase